MGTWPVGSTLQLRKRVVEHGLLRCLFSSLWSETHAYGRDHDMDDARIGMVQGGEAPGSLCHKV